MITYNMFVHRSDASRLEAAIEHVKNDDRISNHFGLEHWVSRETSEKPKYPDSVWFEITVSRPYLIFKIGEKYANLKR